MDNPAFRQEDSSGVRQRGYGSNDSSSTAVIPSAPPAEANTRIQDPSDPPPYSYSEASRENRHDARGVGKADPSPAGTAPVQGTGGSNAGNAEARAAKMGDDGGDGKVVLKRRVGLISGVALIVGTIIGSGIFVSPGSLLNRTGSVSVGLIIWVACGLLSLFGALAYAELGGLFPKNGGEYVYFYDSMKDLHPFLGPLPGFLFVWVNTLLLKPSSMAILTLTFSRYLLRPIWSDLSDADTTDDRYPDYEAWSQRIVAATCAGLIVFINCYNVKLAARVQTVFTVAKLAAMGVIIVGGLIKIGEGNHKNLESDFVNTGEAGKLASAFYGGLWAYDGWNQLNYVTEEIENPYVNLPRAIMIALPLCIVLYLLINIAYLSVMTAQEIIASSAVAVDFGERVLGKKWAWTMSVAVAISTFGAANGTEFTAGRLTYSAAKEGQMPEVLSYIHIKSFSPSPPLILNGVLAVVMIVAGDIESLIDFFSFTSWIFYGGAMVVLIAMRWIRKDAPRPYKVNIIIPSLVALISVYLVIGPIVDDPAVEYLYALGFIAAGLLVYVPIIHYKYTLPGTRGITYFLQMVLQVVPTEKDEIPAPP